MIRSILRWVLAWFYAVAGYFHLARPDAFMEIMPGWVPVPETVVLWTGIAEIAGAFGLLQPWSQQLRQAAGVGLALYALCVWPANIHHFALDMARESAGEAGSLGLAYHVPRMIAQPIIIWLALWVGPVSGRDDQPAPRPPQIGELS